MGYPNFGKVKTITLPMKDLPYGATLEDYKKLYGIDLKQWVRLSGGDTISLKLPENAFVLIQSGFGNIRNSIASPILETGPKKYVANSDNGELVLYTNIEKSEGLILYVESDREFTIENVQLANYNQY